MIRIGWFLLIFLLLSCSITQRMTQDQLRTQILAKLRAVEGDFAVAFKTLDGPPKSFYYNERERFHAASTMKTPVMLEVYKQVAEGKFGLDTPTMVKNEFKSIVDGSPYSLSPTDDSYEPLYRQVGQVQKLYDLVYEMIIHSSNLATNLVIELVDAKKVMATLRSMGINDMQVLRGVEDNKAYRAGLNNSTTAYDLALLFEQIALKQVVNPSACDEMLKILLDQRFNEIIPARLPKGVKVAHKTGQISGVEHDSGVVFMPDGRRYVVVLLSKNLKDPKKGIKAMAEVSELLYRYAE
jgi:beta-lactamase class A